MASTTGSTSTDTAAEVETQLRKVIEKTTWPKRMTPTMAHVSALFGSQGYGSEVHTKHWHAVISPKL